MQYPFYAQKILTKKGSDFLNWQDRANALFFVKKMSIVEINKRIGVSKKSITNLKKKQPNYKNEKERRKIENQKKHQEYKRQWSKINYYNNIIDGETLKREHDVAAYILSRERH